MLENRFIVKSNTFDKESCRLQNFEPVTTHPNSCRNVSINQVRMKHLLFDVSICFQLSERRGIFATGIINQDDDDKWCGSGTYSLEYIKQTWWNRRRKTNMNISGTSRKWTICCQVLSQRWNWTRSFYLHVPFRVFQSDCWVNQNYNINMKHRLWYLLYNMYIYIYCVQTKTLTVIQICDKGALILVALWSFPFC